jgi:hypothetical protein
MVPLPGRVSRRRTGDRAAGQTAPPPFEPEPGAAPEAPDVPAAPPEGFSATPPPDPEEGAAPAAGAGLPAGVAPEVSAAPLASAFFVFFEAYRSEYQPPPLSWKVVRETSRASLVSPHSGQEGGGSLMRCMTSVMRPHASQTYS